MNTLQIMGCTSDQYGSMERYLVEKARIFSESGSKFFVVYENLPSSQQFIRDFRDAGGQLFAMKLKNFFDFHYYRGISRIIKEKKIDVIHGYFSPTCHYLNIYLTFRGFKNLIRTAPNLPISFNMNQRWKNPLYRFYFSLRHKFLSLFVRKIICRSRAVKYEYEKLGVSPQKLSVALGGVDIKTYKFSAEDREEIREKYHLNNKALVLGTFCRLTSVKRIDKLIRNFSSVEIVNPKIKLFIVGGGPESEHLKNLAKNLSLNNRILFLGHRSDISKLYSALDVFCMPSLAEGMSNSLLEAMSSELPIIATDISPNRELIDEGKGGYLISFEDVREFQDRIERLSDKRLRRDIGKYNRDKVASKFNLRSRIDMELQIYQEMFS